MVNKKAIIFGALGQDGSYMAELLHSKGYEVCGVVRPSTSPQRIDWLKSLVPLKFYRIDILDKQQINNLIQYVKPDEIYNFAGVSSVFNPWENLDHIYDTNVRVPQYILESILQTDKSIKFFQASSCLIFGRDEYEYQNESTCHSPIHPYGITKLHADNLVNEFRKVFGLNCRSGIFFNHESPRRGADFFTKKITTQVKEIKEGKRDKIKVGDLSSFRDFGYAPDFMEAAYLMMQSEPKDYIVGTGQLISMEGFVKLCFDSINLNYKDYIEVDNMLIRRNDTKILSADISKIKLDLGWIPKHDINDIIKIMMQ